LLIVSKTIYVTIIIISGWW